MLTQGISNIENIVDDIILKTIQDLGNKKVDNYDDLLYITKLSKNPEDYKGDIAAKTIGIQQNKRKGELIKYFKRNDGKPTINPDEIGWEKYALEYLNLFRRDLQAIGYDMSMLEYFLDIKKHRKENRIEVCLYPIIINLIPVGGNEIPTSSIWNMITSGNVNGYYDDRRPNEYQTADFGTIYRNSITNIICDKFGAQRRHKEKGNILIFD